MREGSSLDRFRHSVSCDLQRMMCRLSPATLKALQSLIEASKSSLTHLHITLRHTIPQGWPWVATGVIIVIAGLIFFLTPDMDQRGHLNRNLRF